MSSPTPSSSSSSSGSSSDGSDSTGGGTREEFERPSSSRQRWDDGVWPEPFIEALAYQVAMDAARTLGRLAAGPAIATVFQVCSTWAAISRSEHLWERLVREIWARDILIHVTWHDEYIFRHVTASNFQTGRAEHTLLHYAVNGNGGDAANINNDRLICRCVALSDFHVGCGFEDGTVRLFDLATRVHVSTFHPLPRPRLGPRSQAVSGIILVDGAVVFASIIGDVHVAFVHGDGVRRAQLGNVFNDGALVSFSGCRRWWVGLFAGAQGRSIHVWDGQTENLVFDGRSLTDSDALQGWRALVQFESVGRVRVSSGLGALLAHTSVRVMLLDLDRMEPILVERELQTRVTVESVDLVGELFLVVDSRGVGRVRRVDSLGRVSRFRVRGVDEGEEPLIACMNGGCVFVWARSEIRVWSVEHGARLYSLEERVDEATALAADERHLVACSSDGSIHLWDFGAF
ncbi:hypothetical protein Syun_009545 [Stephania yunnanensis]|uniref:Transcriptional regulator STERILE APETALA-like n=1 Tax=Stephania yunnanensis TaxID=152371 RepID=A0AAP0KEM9_9MAGN